MIIKGGSRSNGGFFAKHLQNELDNEKAELVELRGVVATTVDEFFRELADVASGTRCKNHFYHAAMSPARSDNFTREDAIAGFDMLEKNLGLEGQPRLIMEHIKDGELHWHAAWGRIDIETMRARPDALTYRIHERTSREIEERFNLERVKSTFDREPGSPRAERRPPDWEGFRASQKPVIDKDELKIEITELWRTTDSNKAFAAAVNERGYVLGRGDQRGYVLVDHAGDVHPLARCIEGVKTADVRQRMAGIDLAGLPSVKEAREQQRAPFTHDGKFDRTAAVKAWRDRGYERPARAAEPQQEKTAQDPLHGSKPKPERDFKQAAGESTKRQTRAESKTQDTQDSSNKAEQPRDKAPRGPEGIKVTDGAGKVIGGIADVALSLMAMFDSAPPPPRNPHLEQQRARERAIEALEDIRASIERDETVSIEDLKKLTPQQRENLAKHGDRAMHSFLEREEERDRRDRYGGGRER